MGAFFLVLRSPVPTSTEDTQKLGDERQRYKLVQSDQRFGVYKDHDSSTVGVRPKPQPAALAASLRPTFTSRLYMIDRGCQNSDG